MFYKENKGKMNQEGHAFTQSYLYTLNISLLINPLIAINSFVVNA
jgi:hypothetical protein